MALAALGDRARHEIDAELLGQGAGPAQRATALERLRMLGVDGRAAAQVEALGKHHELGAVGRRGTHEPVRLREVADHVGVAFELDCRGAQRASPSSLVD